MAFAVVAHESIAGNTNGFSGAGSIDTTGCNAIFLVAATFTSTTPTDSKGNTYTLIDTVAVGGGEILELWAAIPATGGTGHTFTYSIASAFCAVSLVAVSGCRSASAQDGSATHALNTGVTQPGSITPNQPNSLWVTGYGSNFTGSAPTVSAPFTADSIADHVPPFSTAYTCGIAWNIQTTATAQNPSWDPGGAFGGGAIGAVFKPALTGAPWRLALMGVG